MYSYYYFLAMVGIFFSKLFIATFKKDTRFFKRKVRVPKHLRSLFKKHTDKELLEMGFCYVDILHWDTIMLLRFLTPITLSTNSNLNAITHEILLKKNFFYWFLVLLRFELSFLFFPHDMSYINNKQVGSSFLFAPVSCLFFHINLYVRQELKSSDSILSLSETFQGLTWVERELSEFHQLYFSGLRDGRRLLTDYGTSSVDYNSYKTLSYNLISQDLFNV